MKKGTILKIVLAVILMIIPAAVGITIGTSREYWAETEEQYTYWSLSRIGISDKGPVLSYVDYTSGFGTLEIVQLDENARDTGVSLTVSEDNSDVWAPFVGQVGDVIIVAYTRTTGNINDARIGTKTPVELVIMTLDPETFEPSLPHPEPLVIASLDHEGTEHGYVSNDGLLYAWFEIEDEVRHNMEGQTQEFFAGDEGGVPHLDRRSDTDPEYALFSISPTGLAGVTYLETKGVNFNMLKSNRTLTGSPWEGMDILLTRESRNGIDSMALFRGNGSTLRVWEELENDIYNFEHVSRFGDDIYFTWEYPELLNVPLDNRTEFTYSIDRTIWSERAWGVAYDEGGNATFCWGGEDKDRDDDDNSLYFVTLSQTETGPEIMRQVITPQGYGAARYVYVGEGRFAGIVITEGPPPSYTGFTYQDGVFRTGQELVTLRGMGLGMLMLGLLASLGIGMVCLILSFRGQRTKAFRKMNVTQLQLFNEKQLRKAIGKEAKGWTKEEMITYLSKPEEPPDHPREEERRLFSLLPVKYVYFSMIVFGMAPLFLNIIYQPSPHPAFIVGVGTHIDTVTIAALLSVVFVLSLGEFGTTRIRKAVLTFMLAALVFGEAALIVFMYARYVPPATITTGLDMFFLAASPVMLLAMGGPFIFLYERFKSWTILTILPLFAIPMLTYIFLIGSFSMSEGIMSTPTSHLSSVFLMTSFPKLFVYMFVAMGGGLAFSSYLSLNNIKPVEKWTKEDLDIARRLPFFTALIGALLFGSGLILAGVFLGTELTGEVFLMAVMGGMGLVLGLMGVGPWWFGLKKARDMNEITKDISSVYLSVFFTPGITLMGGFCLAFAFGIYGAVIGAAATLFQVIYGNHKLKEYTKDILKDIREKKPKAAPQKVEIDEPSKMDKQKLPIPRKAFVAKVNKNLKSVMTVLTIFSIIGLLINMFGSWIPQVKFLREIGLPDIVYLLIHLVLVSIGCIIAYKQLRSVRSSRSPMELLNTTSVSTLMVIGILSGLGLGAMVSGSLYFFIGIAALLISAFFIQKMVHDAVIKRFDELPAKHRKVYPAEFLVFLKFVLQVVFLFAQDVGGSVFDSSI
ncbi:MAG: hypothetical protein ACMUIE_10760 [Thermoplasmatota archaeon]